MKAANAKRYLKQTTAASTAGKPTTAGGRTTKPAAGFVSKEDELLMDEMLESGEAEGPDTTEPTEQELRDEGQVWDSPGTTQAKKTKAKGTKNGRR